MYETVRRDTDIDIQYMYPPLQYTQTHGFTRFVRGYSLSKGVYKYTYHIGVHNGPGRDPDIHDGVQGHSTVFVMKNRKYRCGIGRRERRHFYARLVSMILNM